MSLGIVVGLAIMIGTEAATLAGLEPFRSWNTPIAWTGFILFADSFVYRARGRSWMRSHPREFIFLTLVSVPLWVVFEFYNLFIKNWYYTGLPENFALRCFGYAWSFATIWPAIFEGSDLISVLRHRTPTAGDADTVNSATLKRPPRFTAPMWLSFIAGAVMLAWPLVWPSAYLAAPIWLGFIFLLEPVNARLGGERLGDRRNDRLVNLAASGLLCGFLWEFWNYWAAAKWHYTVPIMENVKIFEMPLPGYLGFPAFALECFTMYVLVRTLLRPAAPAYPVGL